MMKFAKRLLPHRFCARRSVRAARSITNASDRRRLSVAVAVGERLRAWLVATALAGVPAAR